MPLQHIPAATRFVFPEAATPSEIIPLRRSLAPRPAPFADLSAGAARPCGFRMRATRRVTASRLRSRAFSLERQAMRCCSARGATCLTSNPFGRASQARRLNGFVRPTLSSSSTARADAIGEPDQSRTRTIPSTSSAAALPDAGPIRVMRRHVPACGVPLPAQKIRPSRPGRTEWSSLDYPRLDSAHGVSNLRLCPSQVCSR